MREALDYQVGWIADRRGAHECRLISQVISDIGLTLIVYSAQPDSPSQEALNRLGNWSEPRNKAPR